MLTNCRVVSARADSVEIAWEYGGACDFFRVLWSDRMSENMQMKPVWEGGERTFTFFRSTHFPHYFRIQAVRGEDVLEESETLVSPVGRKLEPQLEKLNRGLIAARTDGGIFLAWRLLRSEVTGFSDTGVTGADFFVYRNGKRIAKVEDSTNYLDPDGGMNDVYAVSAVTDGVEQEKCAEVGVWKSGKNYVDLPIRRPEGGVNRKGEKYEYHANDMSVGDVNGDGELEYILKWEPSNAKDNSQKGFTGNCVIDCYTLDGRLLWRLDMGRNIRAGAHYTQFMVYDFDGDGRAEMAVKTAPGTKMTVYREDGSVRSESFITMPERDVLAGYGHGDDYACTPEDYREYLIGVFENWHLHPEVLKRRWPGTVEECFGLPRKYVYPLSRRNAEKLADYFIYEYAPARSPKNELWNFEGFVFKGPEYLTMFAGDGRELQTIDYPYPRVDDGLMWGDYSWTRVEPCNRVDRFLAGVAYLDGERPYLIMCRGYYTRTTLAAYDFFEGRFRLKWGVDSGFVPMRNPFAPTPDGTMGLDPVYGIIAGQGNHSLSVADVDGDGCDEIIYGACTIDHDGSVLFSGAGFLSDGRYLPMGHGDSMHVAVVDPDTPGMEVMHVFEDGNNAPYGDALLRAEDGSVVFGVPSDKDLGRCMIGKIDPETRGLQVWVRHVRDCKGNLLDIRPLSTNACIRWAEDLSTQVTDGADYLKLGATGVVNDRTHGVMLTPEGTLTNNYTKANPCLIANIFGDFREQILLRLADESAIRIYTNTNVTHHKLYTLLHDVQYRCGVAWQNDCYNQPVYPSFYYGEDMNFKDSVRWLGT